jgi:hypothetical protein
MMHSKKFGGRELVTAYVDYNRHFGDLTVTFDINWSCCGNQTIEETKEFHDAMGKAISYLDHLRDNHIRATSNGMTHDEWMKQTFPELA